MNKIFKTKYCEKRQTYLATHEKAKIGVPATSSASNGRICLKYNVIALAISALFTQSLFAQGLVNPNVVAGQATINAVNQTNTVIQQTTNKAVINWEKFTIPKDNRSIFNNRIQVALRSIVFWVVKIRNSWKFKGKWSGLAAEPKWHIDRRKWLHQCSRLYGNYASNLQ